MSTNTTRRKANAQVEPMRVPSAVVNLDIVLSGGVAVGVGGIASGASREHDGGARVGYWLRES